MNRYYLGIDNGGTMTKAAIFDLQGCEISVASITVTVLRNRPGWRERDADQLWLETAQVIRKVIKQSGVSSHEIVAVGCTGHGNGLYLIDDQGASVRNAIYSTDERAQGYIDSWKSEGIGEKALSKTTQSLWAAQPNALLAWLRDEEPQSYKRISSVLMAKDYVRFRLTGEIYAEVTDMSGTSLMNVAEQRYDPSVLALFGLDEMIDKLPPLINSSDEAGRVTASAAELTGLKEGTPVAAGMFDIDACAISSGICTEKEMSLVAGTWGNNQYIAKEPLVDKDLFMTSLFCIPGWYLMLEGSPTSAGNLNWFIDQFLLGEKGLGSEKHFELINQRVDSIEPEENQPLFLPFLYGCNETERVKATFYGMNGGHTQSNLLRAVYEGIAFSHKTHVDRLMAFRDKPEVIRCSGGASNSKVWMQMFADVLEIPIEVPAGNELGALGAAMAASVVAGDYSSLEEAIGAMTTNQERFEPNPSRRLVYQNKYQQYKRLCNCLAKLD